MTNASYRKQGPIRFGGIYKNRGYCFLFAHFGLPILKKRLKASSINRQPAIENYLMLWRSSDIPCSYVLQPEFMP